MEWLNQGMIMFKLLNFKDLLGSMIHLLMTYIEIRFFKNKGKYQYSIVIPISNVQLKDWLSYLTIFAYKNSDT